MVDHSVMGLVDVIKNYSFLKGLFDNTLNWIKNINLSTFVLLIIQALIYD